MEPLPLLNKFLVNLLFAINGHGKFVNYNRKLMFEIMTKLYLFQRKHWILPLSKIPWKFWSITWSFFILSFKEVWPWTICTTVSQETGSTIKMTMRGICDFKVLTTYFRQPPIRLSKMLKKKKKKKCITSYVRALNNIKTRLHARIFRPWLQRSA